MSDEIQVTVTDSDEIAVTVEGEVAITLQPETETLNNVVSDETPVEVTVAPETIVEVTIEGGAGGTQEPDYNSAEADEDIISGQPVYLKSNGHIGLAKADNPARTKVIGLAFDSVAPGFSCRYITDGELSNDDWTDIIGSEQLEIGQIYYLDPDNSGKLTTIAPITSGQYVVKVGIALTVKKIDIEIQQSIML